MKKCSNCGAEVQEKFCPKCGTKCEDSPSTQSAPVQTAQRQDTVVTTTESKFTGGAFANYFIGLLAGIVSVISIGLLAPAMICWKQRWVAKHTYINGKQLVFDGRGIQLLGKFILWELLSIVTFGIYALWLPVKVEKWITKHTHFQGETCNSEEENKSEFDGRVIGLIGVTLLATLVTIVTFSFGLYWAICYCKRWWTKHTVIDGQRLTFDGRGIQLFGKLILWELLTVITFGIYSFWLVVKLKKWIVSHTHIDGAILSTDTNGVTAPAVELTSEEKNALAAENRSNSKGLSIAGFILSFINPFVGLILCSIAVGKKYGARKLAIAGLVISCLWYAVSIVFLLM